MEFYKTEDGKIMTHVVHDHNTGMGLINNWVVGIERRLEHNGEVSMEELKRALAGIKAGVSKAKEAVDYGYVKFKERNQ